MRPSGCASASVVQTRLPPRAANGRRRTCRRRTRIRRPPPQLPLDVFGPFWSDWIATAAEAASAPPDYVVGPVLAGASTLIGNARWVSPWRGWKEPPILWIGVVGDPSAGKSPGADPVPRMGDRRQPCRRMQSSLPSRCDHGSLSPMPRPKLSAYCSLPMTRVCCSSGTNWRDGLAYSGSGADRAFWIEAFGGRCFTIDRVKHPQPIVIPHLSVAVLGGTQPDRLVDLLHSPDDGLQSRFLWMWPNAVPPRRPTRCPDAAAALEAFRRLAELPLVLGASDERPRPFICPLEDGAAALFDQWRHDHAAIEVSGALASAFGKAPGHLLRLALVLEHLWWSGSAGYAPPSRIGRHALSAAAALIEDYFKPMAIRVFGDAALPEADRLATTLARWLLRERPKVVNARDLRRKARLQGLREAEKVKLALATLSWRRTGCGHRCRRAKEVVSARITWSTPSCGIPPMSSKWLDTFRAIDFSEYPPCQKCQNCRKYAGADFRRFWQIGTREKSGIRLPVRGWHIAPHGACGNNQE